jgi:hypothetical protein
MTLDGRVFCFASTVAIRQILETLQKRQMYHNLKESKKVDEG